MAAGEELETRQESGRLVAFSDGVVAIAITLLILPLADITLPSDNTEAETNPLGYVWSENSSLIVSFLVSWFVILIFWLLHHKGFATIERVNERVIRWNVLWLFGIVVLPFPMNLLNQTGPDSGHGASRQTTTFYIFTMFFISLMMTLIVQEIRKEPTLAKDPSLYKGRATSRSWLVTVYLAVLVPLAWLIPNVAIWGLLGMMFLDPIVKSIDDVMAQRDARAAKPEIPPNENSEEPT
jgi:uncharacterized membrane protein